MKLLSYTLAICLSASIAGAESISDQELQKRFNKAFDVFNQQTSESVSEQTQDEVPTQKTETSKDDKNIVIYSNDIQEGKAPVAKTEILEMPTMKNKGGNSASNFIFLQDRPIVIDMQNATLKEIVQEALNQISASEKWTIKWRLQDQNKYILKEKMNLTAEVDFDSFIGNMIETISNITGIQLSTKVFNRNKIIIITDSY